ncbi:MAG: YeeE/YedE family protein [Oscillospiraceae bacterium]|nr:YeeE/YedE family protein [Oscillospiraceae bacterium]
MAKKTAQTPAKTSWLGQNWLLLLTGFLVGAAAIVLNLLGNPGNMGFCIACFERDIAGALGLHSAAPVQYFRPEIVGIVLGSLLMALARKEFRGKGGSAPALRFGLGALVMIGALVFLGCPLRQLVLAGEGNSDSAVTVLGMIFGAALSHNFKLASSGDGSTPNGHIAVIGALAILLLVSLVMTFSKGKEGKK